MAVITLWIVTADQGHNKTIVAAILEKVLNRDDMLSEGYTSLLNLIINSKGTFRPAWQWQIQTQRKEPNQNKDSPHHFNWSWGGCIASNVPSSELVVWNSSLLRGLVPTYRSSYLPLFFHESLPWARIEIAIIEHEEINFRVKWNYISEDQQYSEQISLFDSYL